MAGPAPFTRRSFLQSVGASGGAAAAYRMTLALGLMPRLAAADRPDLAPAGSTAGRSAAGKPGRGRSVLILGGGISGLTCAYELDRKGYQVTVLEASHRAGGRNLTLRHGSLIDEAGYPRTCGFDDDPDLYFNAGPARIPGHHSALLGYCRELGVALEPFVNDNRDAWIQDDAMYGGKPVRARDYINDTRGFITELAAKGLRPASLDTPFSSADYDRVLEYLRQLGDLDGSYRYRGTARAGLARHDPASPPVLKEPKDVEELLKSKFMYMMSFGETDDQAAMMMEPVGGMDKVVDGFMRKVGHLVRLHCQAQSISVRDGGVDVAYRDGDGRVRRLKADYCLSCVPMHLLAGLEHNFPADYAAGMLAVPRGKLFKAGLQMRERFWEKQGIYGGISWTTQDIQQVWYPPHGIQRQKGVVLGAYTFSEQVGERFARMTHEQRIAAVVAQGEKIHPGYGGYVEQAVSIPWIRMNHMLGCAAEWTEAVRARHFEQLRAPVGNFYMMGDQLSYLTGWQEGAIASAYHVLADLDRRERALGVAGTVASAVPA